MWERNGNRNEVQPMIEALESRELMSAAPHAAVVVKHAPTPHAVVMSVKPAAKPKATPAPKAVKATPAPKAAAKPKATPAPKPVKATPAPKAAAKATPAVKTTTPPIVNDLPAYVPAAHPGMAPDMVGGWTGTMTPDGAKQSSAFSINFTFQRGIAFTGTFNLGAAVGNQTVVSTFVFGANRNARALVLTSTLWMGFTAALTANGNMLYGRYAVNTSNGWMTGSFSLTRN